MLTNKIIYKLFTSLASNISCQIAVHVSNPFTLLISVSKNVNNSVMWLKFNILLVVQLSYISNVLCSLNSIYYVSFSHCLL